MWYAYFPYHFLTWRHYKWLVTDNYTYIHHSLTNTCCIIEYYGPKAAKNTVYIGLAMSILVFFVMNVAQAMVSVDTIHYILLYTTISCIYSILLMLYLIHFTLLFTYIYLLNLYTYIHLHYTPYSLI